MNYFGFVFLFVLALAGSLIANVTPRNDFERGVLKLIEKCKKGDVRSLPVPLPSLTPLIMPPRTTYDGRYTMYVGEKKVYGLSNLSVNQLSTSPSRMIIEISVPQLQVEADYYRLQGGIIFARNDQGRFRCDVFNVNVRVDVQFRAHGANTVITALDLSYSIGGLQVYLSGSIGLVQNSVRDKLWNRIHSYETKQRLENAIKDGARKYLRGHTPGEFMKIISSV